VSANLSRVILAGRSEAKIKPAMDRIEETNTEVDVVIVPLDLTDNTSVGQAAKTFNSNVDFLDVLFNNDGVMATKDYTKPAGGFEMHFASNDLSHLLLMNLVTDKIILSKG
jgi:NADP-dependent 3-hydroxy acid dehydrogenase YdfG